MAKDKKNGLLENTAEFLGLGDLVSKSDPYAMLAEAEAIKPTPVKKLDIKPTTVKEVAAAPKKVDMGKPSKNRDPNMSFEEYKKLQAKK